MSHVDDGQLHAYLDGELEALDPEEAAELARHLTSCAACSARLTEAERVRGRAHAILSDADPEAVGVPAWEVVTARPTSARARRISPMAASAWAASLLLALAIGWNARERQPAGEMAQRTESVPTSPRVFLPQPEEPAQPAQTETAVAVRPAAPAADNPVSPGAGAAASPTDPAIAPPDRRQPVAVDVSQPAVSAGGFSRIGVAGGVARGVEGGTPQPAVRLEEVTSTAAPGDAPAFPPVAAPALAARELSAVDSRALVAEGGPWRQVSLAEAERALRGRVQRVEGLPLVATFVGEMNGRAAVRTVQQLGESTVELLQRRPIVVRETLRARSAAPASASAPPPSAPPPPPAADAGAASAPRPLTLLRDGWEITVRAPVSPDSLRSLVGKLRP